MPEAIWRSLRLLQAYAALDDAAFVAPRTGFCPSLKNTLNHIVTVDRLLHRVDTERHHVTNRFASTTVRCRALLVVLFAACDTGSGSAPDAAITDMQEMRDGQTAIDYFSTKPICENEVPYPAVGGDGICTLRVPALAGSSLDFAKVNLVLRVGGARILIFDHVEDAAACHGREAWHYDDASNPAQLLLCPEACSLASSDPDSQVQLLTGCDTQCAQADTSCGPSTP